MSQLKLSFSGRLLNECQIACPALVSALPNRKPYNKHLISLVFSVRTLNYGPIFFSNLIFHRFSRLGPKIDGKKLGP